MMTTKEQAQAALGRFDKILTQSDPTAHGKNISSYLHDDDIQAIRTALEAMAGDGAKSGDYFQYTNSNALGLVRFVGINPNTRGIVVTNEAASDKHLRTVAGWEHLTPTQPPKGQDNENDSK